MIEHDTKLLNILKIGHITSIRGKGISLQKALMRSHYRELRKTFCPNNLVPILEAHPKISTEWILYSKDKRSSGGWYFLDKFEIGQVGKPESRKYFNSVEVAVAEYVVNELDFWASIR
jgi:hypothetical protein